MNKLNLKVTISGAPCSGKTALATWLARHLQNRGLDVALFDDQQKIPDNDLELNLAPPCVIEIHTKDKSVFQL